MFFKRGLDGLHRFIYGELSYYFNEEIGGILYDFVRNCFDFFRRHTFSNGRNAFRRESANDFQLPKINDIEGTRVIKDTIINIKKEHPDWNALRKDGRRLTFPQTSAVSSARAGLTSLFGMGRGEHRLYNHPNNGFDIWNKTYKGKRYTESLRVISTARL